MLILVRCPKADFLEKRHTYIHIYAMHNYNIDKTYKDQYT